MNLRTIFSAFGMTTILAVAGDAEATSFEPRDDMALVALDARTGERLWTHYPEKLSQATTELYPDHLVVHGRVDTTTSSKEFTIGLDPAKGTFISDPTPMGAPLAVSDTFGQPEVRLDNGWKLSFDPGNDEKLDFVDGQGNVVWTIQAGGFPEHVTSWHDTVFWEMSYPEETVVYAYEASATMPKWTFDPKALVNVTDEPTHRLHIKVFGDDFYVGLHEHLFLLDPATGMVKRQWNLSALTGVPFVSNTVLDEAFFHGGLEMATLSGNAETLVLGFEGQIIALDRPSGDLLWHADSHTVPYDPYPMLHDKLVVVTAHENLAGPRPPAPPPPALDPSGCSLAGVSSESTGGGSALLILGFVGLFGLMRRSESIRSMRARRHG
ncbi:MAG: PQQ-binding-like beta-propeller repeat protein [Polyangiaceae bacterium]|nr:PQQ-binding-like beta-propeller repeat protein [Polyangiaceae bacterium]